MTPTPDERWAVLHGIPSYEKYLEKVSDRIFLKPEVDEDVKGIFKLVQKLIDLAYYEYEFLDIASLKALFAFELALKKVYQEVNGLSKTKPGNLKGLLDWFRTNEYFETDSAPFLDQIRYIRNHFAHPDYHSFGGPMVSWHIPAAAALTNDLYEDVGLRKARRQETEFLNTSFEQITKAGALLIDNQGRESLVYYFITGFINNKHSDKRYHFIYKPIFEIPKQYAKGDSIFVYPAHKVSCDSVQVCDNELIGLEKDENEVFRLSASPIKYEKQLSMWYDEYKAYVAVLPHVPLINTGPVSELMSILLSDFHKSHKITVENIKKEKENTRKCF